MSPRTTGVLALIALAMGAFVYFYEIEGEVSREAAVADEKNLFAGLEAEDVDAVSLVTLDGIPARFERREGVWFVVEPVVARADATALDAIAHALTTLPREGTVGAGGDPAGFGLGPDAASIRFEAAGATRGLRVGGTTPVGGHRYVARMDDDEVAYVASYRVNAFARNLSDLRDRRVFGFEDGEVTTLRLVWSEDEASSLEVALARGQDGRWHLGSPIVGLADQETVRDVVSNLAYLRSEQFVDTPQEAIRGALDVTALAFHWTIEGEHLERHARIAGEVDGRRVFASNAGRIDLIAASRLDEFPRRLFEYRFRRISEFALADARRIEMQFAEQGDAGTSEPFEATARLEDAGWRGRDSEGEATSPARLSELVRVLSSLDASDIFAEEMGPRERAGLSLDPPLAALQVFGEGPAREEGDEKVGDASASPSNTLASLRIGRLFPSRGVFVQRADSPTIFLVDTEGREALPISGEHFRKAFRVDATAVEEASDEGVEDAVAALRDDEVVEPPEEDRGGDGEARENASGEAADGLDALESP